MCIVRVYVEIMRSVFLWSYLYVGVEDDGAVDIVIDVVAAAEDGV